MHIREMGRRRVCRMDDGIGLNRRQRQCGGRNARSYVRTHSPSNTVWHLCGNKTNLKINEAHAAPRPAVRELSTATLSLGEETVVNNGNRRTTMSTSRRGVAYHKAVTAGGIVRISVEAQSEFA